MSENSKSEAARVRPARVEREEIEQALLNNPIPVIEQDVEGDVSYVYYGETDAGRLLAVIVTEESGVKRGMAASDLNADQRVDYAQRRARFGKKAPLNR